MTQKRFGGKRVKRRNVLLGFKLGGDDDGQFDAQFDKFAEF